MPQALTIEFDLGRDMATLKTPYSHAEFSDTETGRAMLFRALRAVASYQVRRERMGETNAGKDVTDAVLAYDIAELNKMAKRYDEKGNIMLDVTELELDFD